MCPNRDPFVPCNPVDEVKRNAYVAWYTDCTGDTRTHGDVGRRAGTSDTVKRSASLAPWSIGYFGSSHTFPIESSIQEFKKFNSGPVTIIELRAMICY